MRLRGYTAFFAWPFCVVALGLSPASAQEQCTNGQSVGCEYDPNYGGWIKRGSAPPTSNPDSGYQSPAQVDQEELEKSTQYNQDLMRQQKKDAERVGPGTCKLDPPPPRSEPYKPELQQGMLQLFTQGCLEDHEPGSCYSAAEEHTFDTVPEAHPNLAYRFIKLGCQYGSELDCEVLNTQCIPE